MAPDRTPDDLDARQIAAHRKALVAAATAEFEISEHEARAMADEVMLASILHRARITDLRAWLLTSMKLALEKTHARRGGGA